MLAVDKKHSADNPPVKSFFGRRKTKTLSNRKQKNMNELLPRLQINIQNRTPDSLKEMFGGNKNSYYLEIGFGSGEHLVRLARENENVGFIGAEPFVNGMAKILGEIEEYNLKNVRLYHDDAVSLLDWLPQKCLEGVYLLYPDPWPKKRNWKRRFVNGENLQRIHKVLKKNGKFRFASDIEDYVNWTLRHIKQNEKFEWSAKNAEDWKTPWGEWEATRYEAKAIKEGRVPCYLEFIAL